MNQSDAFAVKPLVGLGPLRFGARRHEVSAFDAAFGPVERIVDESAVADPVLEAVAPFAGEDPEIRALMAQLKAQRGGVVSEHRALSSPILRFRDDALFEIALGEGCVAAHLDGLRLLVEDRAGVVAALTARNGGRKAREGVYLFDRLGLLLHGFAPAGGERIVVLVEAREAAREAAAFADDR